MYINNAHVYYYHLDGSIMAVGHMLYAICYQGHC